MEKTKTKRRKQKMKYQDLKQFEKIHGQAFIYALEKLETILEGKNEEPDKQNI